MQGHKKMVFGGEMEEDREEALKKDNIWKEEHAGVKSHKKRKKE